MEPQQIQEQKLNKTTIIIYSVFIGIILILLAILIFKPNPVIKESDNKQSLDSISLLHKQVVSSNTRILELQNKYDSISHIEPIIQKHTHEKVKFIFSTHDPATLDSIIRSTWKTKH